MRRPRPPDVEPSPYDGWCVQHSGELVYLHPDTPVNPTMPGLQAYMVGVRGAILAGGLTVENELILLQVGDRFGTVDIAVGGQAVREAIEALRNDPGLERKIDAAKPILRRILAPEEADRLIQDLGDYRRLRHLMAHRTSWLRPIWDPDAGDRRNDTPGDPPGRTIGFRLFIADQTFVWEVDEAQAEEWRSLLGKVANGLTAARVLMLPPSV